MTKIMFVCLGNICRSPAAEGVFQHMVNRFNLGKEFHLDSSGTNAFNPGGLPDERMRDHASRRGYELTSKSQQFKPEFFEEFDYIITMDKSNYANVVKLAGDSEEKKKVVPFAQFCIESHIEEVPDPYHEGPAGFEMVLDIIEDGCQGLMDRLRGPTHFFDD